MRLFSLLLLLPLLAACPLRDDLLRQAGGYGAASGLSEAEITAGLKEALAQGTQRAVATLGRQDGFWRQPALRIPLPEVIARHEAAARRIGLGARVDEFHLTLNRAAEQATAEVGDVLAESIRRMSVADARAILKGAPDAATQYFQRTSDSALQARILPIVREATTRVGVTQQYKRLSGALQSFGTTAAPDLDAYVTERSLQALYAVMAEEEGRIRQNPAARGTELLRKVFGKASP